MRTLLISICATSLAVAGGLFAGCSSDDSGTTGATDAGTDTSTTTDSGGPKDSGGTDSGGPVACELCGTATQIGPQNLCDDAGGPPSSQDLFLTFTTCFCGPDAGCATVCSNTCINNNFPSTDCSNCFEAQCGGQLAACLADGQDGGTVDAGDGGDGG